MKSFIYLRVIGLTREGNPISSRMSILVSVLLAIFYFRNGQSRPLEIGQEESLLSPSTTSTTRTTLEFSQTAHNLDDTVENITGGSNVVEMLFQKGATLFLEIANMSNTSYLLKGEDAKTVIAPTNRAFTNANPLVLYSILQPRAAAAFVRGRVFKGRHLTRDLMVRAAAGELVDASGNDVALDVYGHSKIVIVNGEEITEENINATDGIVHFIDTIHFLPEPDEILRQSTATTEKNGIRSPNVKEQRKLRNHSIAKSSMHRAIQNPSTEEDELLRLFAGNDNTGLLAMDSPASGMASGLLEPFCKDLPEMNQGKRVIQLPVFARMQEHSKDMDVYHDPSTQEQPTGPWDGFPVIFPLPEEVHKSTEKEYLD